MLALRDVSVMVRPGEIVALVGNNGAGKSTLLKTVIGLVRPSSGQIMFDGTSLDELDTAARIRQGIGYSPEGRRIFPGMTVRENLEVAWRGDRAAARMRLAEVYQLFPALETNADVPGWRLSGGQQQMLAIGRALVSGGKLLLLDEPSLGLAPALMQDVFVRIRRIASTGRAVLMADQNIGTALAVAHQICVLRAGQLVAKGPAGAFRGQGEIAAALLTGEPNATRPG
ncbi:MAG TPA: ABC transporter ATP-binding protein [Alphaproteobacteria bacterium]